MDFKRTLFVKDIYNLDEIYSSFRALNFSDVNSFIEHVKRGWIYKEQEYKVDVWSVDDVVSLALVYDKSPVIKDATLVFEIKSEEALEALLNVEEEMKIFKNTIMAFDNTIGDYFVNNHEEPYYCLNNSTRLNGCYKADNFFSEYKKDVGIMLKAHRHRMRYKLSFDYASFESAPLEVLHSLKFVCNQLYIFTNAELQTELSCVDDAYDKKSGTRRLTMLLTDKVLEGYLNDKGEIFLDKEKTICYLKEPEKEKGMEELSKIRSLIDIKFRADKNPYNGYLIDLASNVKIMRDLYNPPYLSIMVSRWLVGEEL